MAEIKTCVFLDQKLLAWLILIGAIILSFIGLCILLKSVRHAFKKKLLKEKKLSNKTFEQLLLCLKFFYWTIIYYIFFIGIAPFEKINEKIVHQVGKTLIIICLYELVRGISIYFFKQKLQYFKKEKNKHAETMSHFYIQGIRIFVFLLVLFMILSVWGFNISGMLAGLGIGGLAVSLAAKDTLSNLIAGIMLMSDNTLQIGDLIQVNEVEGTVENIGYRASKIRTYEQSLAIIPNALLSNNSVINISAMGKRRLRFNLFITNQAGTEKIDALFAGIKALMTKREVIILEESRICVEDCKEMHLIILVQCYLKVVDYQIFVAEKDFLLRGANQLVQELGIDFRKYQIFREEIKEDKA